MKIVTPGKTALGALAAALVTLPALAFGAEGTEIKGVILSHTGETIVVRSSTGDVPVMLSPTTKVRAVQGSLGVRNETHPHSDLIRGLSVDEIQNNLQQIIDKVKARNPNVRVVIAAMQLPNYAVDDCFSPSPPSPAPFRAAAGRWSSRRSSRPATPPAVSPSDW